METLPVEPPPRPPLPDNATHRCRSAAPPRKGEGSTWSRCKSPTLQEAGFNSVICDRRVSYPSPLRGGWLAQILYLGQSGGGKPQRKPRPSPPLPARARDQLGHVANRQRCKKRASISSYATAASLIPPPCGEGGWPKFFIWASRGGGSHNGNLARGNPTPAS